MAVFLPLNADNWNILYSSGLGQHPDSVPGQDAWSITLSGNAEPHYITRSCTNAFRNEMKKDSVSIFVRMRFDGDPDTVTYQALEGGTAAVTVMIRKGTDLTQANNRLWAKNARMVMQEGLWTIEAKMKRGDWSNVDGQTPTTGAWDNMLQNCSSLGVTFGGTFFGHGVKANGGTSVITLDRYVCN